MAERDAIPKTYYDFLSSFEAGMNSGIEPLLLPKNQMAFGLNTSVRGAYVTHRPPFKKKQLIFTSPLVQHFLQSGAFQGAGYYRPDFGTEMLIAHVAGHLFSFVEQGVGGPMLVSDISVPNDLNNATTSQVWMWQSEKYLIVQNGKRLPIFFDGLNSRRSYGPSVILATTAAPFTPPVINGTVTLTLAAPYPGPFNVPVILNGAFYQPVQQAVGYKATLTNLYAIPGDTIPVDSEALVLPASVGKIIFTGAIAPISGSRKRMDVGIEVGSNIVSVGQTLAINGLNWTVQQLRHNPYPGGIVIRPTQAYAQIVRPATPLLDGTNSPAVGQIVYDPNNTQPNVSLGITEVPFVIPSPNETNTLVGTPGGTVDVALSVPYTDVAGKTVWIGTSLFSIAQSPASPPVNTLIVINLTDTTSVPVPDPVDMLSVPELPAGRMGAYGMGRNWMCLIDGISFIAGDIVGGPSGIPANQNRDAVLKTTENDFLSGGGTFRLPGTGDIITAMIFTANLDQSLGQGPLQIGTARSIFSCNTPVDRATWTTLTNPILTQSLIGKGPLGQNSTILVNSDTFFRAFDGLASLILARRDFANGTSSNWGNVPISQEMIRVYQSDINPTLLPYGSALTYDNRFLSTFSPSVSGKGVSHLGLISMNFDTISNLRTKLPPVYDGAWTGLNSIQVVSGQVNGSLRAFTFALNLDSGEVELWEFLQSNTTETMDDGTTPILWAFETPVAFNKDVKPTTDLCRLRDGEIYIKDIIGKVHIKVQYRPDFYPCWTTWREFDVCADLDKGTVANAQPGYRMRIGLGEPSADDCEQGNNRPLRTGYFFQYRVEITGSCKWMGIRSSAVTEPQPEFARPICEEVCSE